MALRETFKKNFEAGKIKVSQDAGAAKAAAERLAKLSKAELEGRLDDVQGLLREVGIELDDDTARALQTHISEGRAANLSQASVVHIDV